MSDALDNKTNCHTKYPNERKARCILSSEILILFFFFLGGSVPLQLWPRVQGQTQDPWSQGGEIWNTQCTSIITV